MVRGQQTTEETLLVTLLLREWDRISEFMCCFLESHVGSVIVGLSPVRYVVSTRTLLLTLTHTHTHTKSCYHLVKQPLGSHNTVS